MTVELQPRSHTSSLHDQSDLLQLYLQRVETLLADVKHWCLIKNLQVKDGSLSINEEPHGEYSAPYLQINTHENKRVADIKPFGESILGSAGRIDVVGEYGKKEKIAYLNQGGPTITTTTYAGSQPVSRVIDVYQGVGEEGWYWVSSTPIHRAVG